MIIKLTLNDNDYGEVISLYFQNFISNLLYTSVIGSNIYDDEILMEWKLMKKLEWLLNPNNDIVYTEEQKQFIIDRIRTSFNRHISKYRPDSQSYIMNNLEISIIDSMEDKWENGEAWYWFQHSDTYLNQ